MTTSDKNARPAANGTGEEQAGQPGARVADLRPRCAARTIAGDPCQGWPSTGTPWCSSHRWTHGRTFVRSDTWQGAHAEAESWIRTVGRPRWPDFAANDGVWAISIATWATYGRKAAA